MKQPQKLELTAMTQKKRTSGKLINIRWKSFDKTLPPGAGSTEGMFILLVQIPGGCEKLFMRLLHRHSISRDDAQRCGNNMLLLHSWIRRSKTQFLAPEITRLLIPTVYPTGISHIMAGKASSELHLIFLIHQKYK